MTYDWMLAIFTGVPVLFAVLTLVASAPLLVPGQAKRVRASAPRRGPDRALLQEPRRVHEISDHSLAECWPGVDPFGVALLERVASILRTRKSSGEPSLPDRYAAGSDAPASPLRPSQTSTAQRPSSTASPLRGGAPLASVQGRGGPSNRDRPLRS